ncbi:MAG: hypothetical protein KAJ32_08195, partial [Gammaproteobacteria bacterium]|nr:hypothetical protein [Gammaproteobacteria bacterium]
MNRFLPTNTPIIVFLSTLLIASCGGGGGDNSGSSTGITYNGNTSPAAIDASNSEAIGKAAGESVQIADTSTNLPAGIVVSSSIDMDTINNIIISIANSSNLPAGLDVSANYCENEDGSAITSDNPPEASGEYDATITFSNCLITGTDFSVTMSGMSVTHIDNINDFPNTGFSIQYNNFTVTDNINDTSSTINLTFACTDFELISSCTYSSDFLGDDGIIHRIAEFNITGTGEAGNGFYGTATFFHGTFGE